MNNKRKGSDLERKVITEINNLDLGYNVGSSRYYSRFMDDNLVDIVDHPESTKKFPYHIQCKSVTGCLKYRDVFTEFKLKDRPLIIFHEVTEKRKSRFFKLEDYVIMKKEDFYDIIKKLNDVK